LADEEAQSLERGILEANQLWAGGIRTACQRELALSDRKQAAVTRLLRRGGISMPIQITTTVRFKFLSLAASSLFFMPATHALAPDNTANNKQPGITADNQSNSASDLAITQKIRKAIAADKTLSTYAHNVKIVTVNGVVTLRGPVRSDEEKLKIGSKAGEVVDESKVDNQLAVKTY
jgi:hypothetical protein